MKPSFHFSWRSFVATPHVLSKSLMDKTEQTPVQDHATTLLTSNVWIEVQKTSSLTVAQGSEQTLNYTGTKPFAFASWGRIEEEAANGLNNIIWQKIICAIPRRRKAWSFPTSQFCQVACGTPPPIPPSPPPPPPSKCDGGADLTSGAPGLNKWDSGSVEKNANGPGKEPL